jgi:hypothetical protein
MESNGTVSLKSAGELDGKRAIRKLADDELWIDPP